MLQRIDRPLTSWERFKSFFLDRFPFWLVHIFRFLINIFESVLKFIIGLAREAYHSFFS